MRSTLLFLGFLAACSDDPEPLDLAPLRAPTGDSATRFVRLDPETTGLEFVHELRPEHVIPYIYNGSGVAVGDYDGDGLPDVYLVSQDGPNKLFRQTAPLRFEDVTAAAGGLGGGEAWGTAASFADVDGDGDLDLYVCNTEAPNLLFQNRGDGTFVECAGKFGLAISAASTGCAFADYDNDGDLDLYLVTNRVLGPTLPRALVDEIRLPADTRASLADMAPPDPRVEIEAGRAVIPESHRDLMFAIEDQVFYGGQRDRLLRNDGYARFVDVTEDAGIFDQGMGLSATWFDYDDDGLLDLFVANDLEWPDTLYHNRGDGTFEDVTEHALPHVAYFGMGSDFGDIDNDGRFDLWVADMSSTTHYMSKMLMGNMGDRRWFLENARPPQYMRNALFVNTGTGRFLEAAHLAHLASTDWTWTVRFADLDLDGRLDAFATNGIPRFDNDPDAAAEFRRLWRLGQRREALEIARQLPPVPEANLALRNAGDLDFEDVAEAWGLALRGVSQGAVFADLDRDGDLDLVVNNQNAPAALFENRTERGHRALVRLVGRESNAFGVGARITLEAGGMMQTRSVSLARGYMSSGEPLAHFGLGESSRIERLRIAWPSGRVDELEDLPANRLVTVRETDAAPPAPDSVTEPTWFARIPEPTFRHEERPFNDYAVQPLLPAKLSQLGPGLAIGDADGDGAADVFFGGAAGQAGRLLVQQGGAWNAVAGPWTDDAECEDMGVLWFDADADGDADLYVVSGGVECAERPELWRDRLYLNDGSGGFARAPDGTLPADATSGSCAVAADWDRDGDLDLFVGGRVVAGRYPEAPPSRLLVNEGRRFEDRTADLAPALERAGLVTGALFTDVDGDGFVDLLVAAHWAPIRWLRNDAGRRFVDRTTDSGLAEHSGHWNGIVSGDFDGDGDLDYVATNLGWNTKYKASADHPMRIYADDFDGNGVVDVIEAKFEGDDLLPVRGRSCSSQAMPFVGERFKTFDAFARASLQDIYSADALGGALAREATTLANAWLVNEGAGRFSVRALPRRAQIAPAYGAVAADFDGDGHPDVALAQNSFAPEPETGRHDGGVGIVLASRPDGALTPVPAARSGLVITGDAAAAAVLDIDRDGRPDLLVARNDGDAVALANRTGPRRAAVRLAGRPGNPSAIGARVSVRLPDGRRTLTELHAGSGYLSQSEPVVFVPQVPDLQLTIRWPDGETTSHKLDSTASTELHISR